MAGNDAVRHLLGQTRVDELIATASNKREIVTLTTSHSVEQALKILARHRILSAPIIGDGEVIGFCDVRDVLNSFLADVDAEQLEAAPMLRKMRLLEDKGGAFVTKKLSDIQHGSDGGFLHESKKKTVSLLELVHEGFLFPTALHGGTSGSGNVVHRLAVFDRQGSITDIVSQSDVIRFLAAHVDELGPLADQTVQQLGWAARKVISVAPERPAFDAMLKMNREKISALAVVSAAGRLIGNYSVSELRTIMADHFGSLALPVGEFLALEHGTEYRGYIQVGGGESAENVGASSGAQWARNRAERGSTSSAPGEEVGQHLVCCSPSSKLREVLQLLSEHRLHRLYVVDEELKPIGLITLTDLLRMCVRSATGSDSAAKA